MTHYETYFNGNTDIQRAIHNLKSNVPKPRRCGRTYTTLLYMAGQIYYGTPDANFLFIGENGPHCHDIKYEFIALVNTKGYSTAMGNAVTVRATNQRFYFYPIRNWNEKMRGVRFEHAFIDVFNAQSYGQNYTNIQLAANEVHYG